MNFNYENKSKLGFTLAEVLVTLGIIGIVSAMTVPTLTQNWQKKAYVAQLKKSYSEISQALENVISDNHAMNLSEAGVYDSNTLEIFTTNYFKKVKNCGSSPSGCFASSYKSINGGSNPGQPYGSRCFVTAGGASICISTDQVFIDVNGQKGPNIVGRDLFAFKISEKGELYGFGEGSYHDITECKNLQTDIAAFFCSGSVINSGWEMKY